MGKAPFTMKGFSYPGKSPIQLVPNTALGASTPAGGLDITTPVTTAGSAGQVPTGGSSGLGITGHPLPTGSSSSSSSGIDIGQIISSGIPGFGGGGGDLSLSAAGIVGKHFMGGIGSGLFGGLFGRRRGQRRQSKTTRGKRGYELSADSWEDTRPSYASGVTSFMNS